MTVSISFLDRFFTSQLIDGAEPWDARMEALGSGPSCSGLTPPRPSKGVEQMRKPQAQAWGFSQLQRVQKACPAPSRAQGNEMLSSVWKGWPPMRRVAKSRCRGRYQQVRIWRTSSASQLGRTSSPGSVRGSLFRNSLSSCISCCRRLSHRGQVARWRSNASFSSPWRTPAK